MLDKVEVVSSELTEYTRWVKFQYEGETYEVMVSVGKNFTDTKVYKDGVEVDVLPDWFGEDGDLVWDIDNLGYEFELAKVSA